MLELLTGAGLAAAAGLNAYIPLLAMGIAARIDWIHLPQGWTWLENEWTLVILAIVAPILVVVALALLIVGFIVLARRRRRKKQQRRAEQAAAAIPPNVTQ